MSARPTARASRGLPRTLLVALPPDMGASGLSRLPPLGPLYLAAQLRVHGYPVAVHDFSLGPFSPRRAADFDVIGFHVTMANRDSVDAALRACRREAPRARLVVGGPQCAMYPQDYAERVEVDALFVGEAEESLLAYVRGDDPASIPGLYQRGDGGWSFTGARAWISDLDALPFPAFDLVRPARYFFSWGRRRPVSSLMSSRGCPFHCSYCFHGMGYEFRPRSPRNVVDEIEWQVRDLGIREIAVWDDNFTFDVARAAAICDEIVARKLDVALQLSNGVRADRLTWELMVKLKRAGTWMISVAPETGCPETAKRIRKGLAPEAVERTIAWSRQLGLRVAAFFVVGFPWESEQDVQDTVDYAFRLDPDFVHFARAVPFPGTRLFDELDPALAHAASRQRPRSYFQRDDSVHLAPIDERALAARLRQANRRFFLRPHALARALTCNSPATTARLLGYALRSRNVL